MSDYGARAAAALERLLPGPHKDKAVQRLFDCSLRMAKYLRAGQYWTADRLTQASRALGADFDIHLVAPSTDAIWTRIGELEREIAALRYDNPGERAVNNGLDTPMDGVGSAHGSGRVSLASTEGSS